MIPQESVSEGQFLSSPLQTTPLTFEEFDLRDDAIVEGGEGVLTSLFKSLHFSLGGLQLSVAAGQVEVGSFHLLEGEESRPPIESGGFIGGCTSHFHRGEAVGIINWNVEAGTGRGDPIPEAGKEGSAFPTGSGTETEGGQKVEAGRFLDLKS